MGGTGTGFAIPKNAVQPRLRQSKEEILAEQKSLLESVVVRLKNNLAPDISGDSEYVRHSAMDFALQNLATVPRHRRQLVQLDDLANITSYLKLSRLLNRTVDATSQLLEQLDAKPEIYLSGELVQQDLPYGEKPLNIHLITNENQEQIRNYMESNPRFNTTYNNLCFPTHSEVYVNHSEKGNPYHMLVELIDQADKPLLMHRDFLNYRFAQQRNEGTLKGVVSKEQRWEELKKYS